MKHVLVLGAGLVARPLVRYLLERGYVVTVATRTVAKAEKILDGHPKGKPIQLNLDDEAGLESLVGDCDLAVSLVPYAYHVRVARFCIAHRKDMVTTSYVSPETQALDDEARAAGVTVLNEIGLDPGIDHMSAMRIIDGVREKGGTITAFRSYCGGLPAPEANDNPFGYKFSWSPRGVLLAGRNSARYLLNGRRVEIPSKRLFRDMHVLAVDDGGDFEAYPNRDSLSYIGVYGLEGIATMFRGTLRNMGWCDSMYNYRRLGLLDLEEVDATGMTYADLVRRLAGAGPSDDPAAVAAAKLGIPRASFPIRNLEWLGMTSDRPLPSGKVSPLDALGTLMNEKLAYRPGERDMIVLVHQFEARYPEGRRERIVSQLVDYGIPGGASSMSRTVALPAAIAVRRILEGEIAMKGVLRPVHAGIYEPVLGELAELGIECRETTETME